ncbi:hypothetical protein DRQ26_04000, partial [bacterium]
KTPKEITLKEVRNPSQENNSFEYLWQILFLLSVVIIFTLLRFLLIYKKEKEVYINKDMINTQQLKQINLEIKNKEKFISHASHELRTPMTSITGLTHLLLEEELSKVQKDYVQTIQNSSENLLNIINDILDISKIQAGELKIEKVEFNINDILDYVFNIISMQAKNNHIDISINIQNDVPSHIVGDSLRLGQILINLLANSVKFTKNGEVSLNVKKLSSYGDSVKLEFTVEDTGIGMSPSQVEHIFQSYSQATESTSREFGGTGLGLSISKQLIDMMNGEIKVSSKENVGTTFIFKLNYKIKDAQNKRQYRLPSATFLDKRVLIVDSSNRSVISLIRTFGYFKYKTHSIPSFEEAILEESMVFDIVIINQNKLTKLAIQRIQKIQSKVKSKVVILSEMYSSLSNDLLKNIKVDTYLKAPFTQQSTLNLVIELYVSKKLNNRSRKRTNRDKLDDMAGKKILVAEDNRLNHKVILGLLAKTGIELTFTVNGQEVLDLLKKGLKFDLILMDINMPVIDGYKTTKEIRKDKRYNRLPILAFTADVMEEQIQKAYASGMQGHISKPIVIDIFYKKILDVLSIDSLNLKSSDTKKSVIATQSIVYDELTVDIGLGRCNNDSDFYKLILEDFKIMYKKSPETLKRLCLDDNFQKARQVIMDIKDVSLNIGAYNLCESASTMEYELEKGSRSNWESLIRFYAVSLDKLFIDIDKYLKTI